ncbi:ABC transporter ATP-binding protein (plasmid) [Agrobacterium sp. rho-8.1]|nr:ABC transporter ATP-binding protein [Agrobacterium sp. rho-8.1]
MNMEFIYRRFETLIRPLDLPYGPIPSKGPIFLLLHFAKMFKGVLVIIILTSMAAEAINLTVIWGISVIVDGVSAKGPATFLREGVGLLATLALLIFPVLPVLIFLSNTLSSQVVSVCMPATIQWHGYKAVEKQDLAFFHDIFAGQVASRISQVASAVQQQLIVAVQSLPQLVVQLIGSVGLLGALSWQLAVPVVIWFIMSVTFVALVVPQLAAKSSKSARARSLVIGAMTDLYSNIQLVKLFASEDSEAGTMRTLVVTAVETQQRERRVFLSTDIAVIILNVLLWFSVFITGIFGLLKSFVSTGEFVAAIYIVQRLASNARVFLQIGQQIFQAMGTIKDAMPVITTPPTITDLPEAKALVVKQGSVTFNAVHFEYRPGKPIISDLNLRVRPAEKVGLVGVSGAGKSTLIHLLLRFFELKSGSIRIDGHDISRVTQASLRDSIGVISQDISLLNRSVLDNIRYGRPNATLDEVMHATALAHADQFIEDLRDSAGRKGYEAFVGDRGIKLSGGQRQRIAIARVLLKNAPLLILDEATSALDSDVEAAIQENLVHLMEGKTVIAIAHRLSTIAQMDRIIVLDEGRIIEEGAPNDLVELDGLYARLWKRQTGGYLAGYNPGSGL